MVPFLPFLALLASLTTVNGQNGDVSISDQAVSPGEQNGGRYRFHYYVNDEATGDFKMQEEIREGALVRGSYSVADPNGNLRTVTYTADKGKGFNAVVNVQPGGMLSNRNTEEGKTPRGLGTGEQVVRMIPPNRYPKPKTPIGNEIGMARMLESNVQHKPGGYAMVISSKPPESDQKESPGVSIDVSMDTATVTNDTGTETTNQTTPLKTEVLPSENDKPEIGESEEQETTEKFLTTTTSFEKENSTEDFVEEEIRETFDSMPKLPELRLSDSELKFHKDPEEASIDERITEVARQLAETSLRREYEERKLGHILPISLKQYFHNFESGNTPRKSDHVGKSFDFPLTNSALVSRFPAGNAQLQLITEVQGIPQHLYKEGFFPVTPAPEFSGPLLGGRPFEKSTSSEQSETTTRESETRAPVEVTTEPSKIEKIKKVYNKYPKAMGRSLGVSGEGEKKYELRTMPVRLPFYLRFAEPEYFFQPQRQTTHGYPVYFNIIPLEPSKPVVQYFDQDFIPQKSVLVS